MGSSCYAEAATGANVGSWAVVNTAVRGEVGPVPVLPERNGAARGILGRKLGTRRLGRGPVMELIIDTADIEAIKELDGILSIAGVTTNPSIITKSGKAPEQVIEELVAYLKPEQKLFVQVVARDFDGIMEETRAICALRPANTYAKIPVTREGLRAIKAAKAEGLNVLATSIYTPEQGFLAALGGADYLAPYCNRMCNYGDGVARVIDLIRMVETQGLSSKVIAASFHNVEQVHQLILAGVPAVTVPPAIAEAMMDHPGTDSAVDDFTADWQRAYGRDTLFS